ncbi:peptidylprolyl isomerase [Propionibacterium cyclohexanicum]|uniref:Peptidyl-prolyl cis-trans isomerase n=1 Tax=Propionibacterium cyclohexanicum TaxID=64702 RepID=A0A1H9T2C2_9ACTN|nr:FKBP-type peptidyl-prolyl cis-trans isomerase [Propionibacterium cyclohexanicum]SER91410.1 peptidylprolyl isomerase [Propionibacterium cyclohexanicum]
MTNPSKPEVSLPESAPDDLVIEDILEGEGPEAAAGNLVEVHYVGVALSTGKEFDSSYGRGEPLIFQLGVGQVISGWDNGVQGMRVGGRRRLVIPPALGYGARGAGGVIGPDETLVFVCDLVGVH